MGAHGFIGFEEGALGEEVQFKVGEEGWKSIGVVPLRDLSFMVRDAEPIGAGSEWTGNDHFEQPCFMQAVHGDGLSILLTEEYSDVLGLRQETSNGYSRGTALGHRMNTKYCEWVPVVALDKLIERQV